MIEMKTDGEGRISGVVAGLGKDLLNDFMGVVKALKKSELPKEVIEISFAMVMAGTSDLFTKDVGEMN